MIRSLSLIVLSLALFLLLNTDSIAKLTITAPNGGEQLIAGGEYRIQWEGVEASEEVKLEYSADGGNTWNIIEEKAKKLEYIWRNIPEAASQQCLIRATIVNPYYYPIYKTLGYGMLHDAKCSPDEKHIASIGNRGIIIWDTETGEVEKIIETTGHYFESLIWTPDNKQLITLGWASGYVDQDNVKIWDVETGTVAKSFQVGCDNDFLVISPDGSSIAVEHSMKIYIISTETGETLHTLTGHLKPVECMAWSPNGTMLASGSSNNLIKIWDVNSGTEIKTLIGHVHEIEKLSWNHAGTKLASTAVTDSTRIWDIESGKELFKLTTAKFGHLGVCWSPDDTKIATGNNAIIIWDANTGDSLFAIEGTERKAYLDWINDGIFSADVHSPWSSGYYDMKIFDPETGDLITNFSGHTFPVNDFSWSPDGSVIAACYDGNRSILLWDVEEEEWTDSTKEIHVINNIEYSPDGSMLATGNNYYDNDVIAKVYHSDNLNLINSLGIASDIDSKSHVAWSPDNNYLAFRNNIWSIQTGEKLFPSKSLNFYFPSWSPDGKYIVGGNRIYDASNGDYILQASAINSQQTSWSPESDLIATTSQIVHSTTGAAIRKYNNTHISGELQCVDWSPDGSKIAVGGNRDSNFVAVYDPNTGEELRWIGAHLNSVNSVEWSPDSKYLASCSDDGTIKIWDFDSEWHPDSDTSDNFFSIEIRDIITKEVDMGEVNIGENKNSTISKYIINNGSQNITVDSIAIIGDAPGQFSVAELSYPFVVTRGGSKNVTFGFRPSLLGTRSASVVVYYQGGSVSQVIRGAGIIDSNPQDIVVVLKPDSLMHGFKPGDIVQIPVRLFSQQNLDSTDVSTIETELHFNPTMLVPLDNAVQKDAYDYWIDLSLDLNSMNGDIFTPMPRFKVTLGNDTTTALTLKNSGSQGNTINITVLPGLFRTAGLCMEGGYPRLLTTEGFIELKTISPNPSSETCRVEYTLIERGITKLYLTDCHGRKLLDIDEGMAQAGINKTAFSVKGLSSGTYMLVLETPTVTKSALVEVVK